MTDPSPSFFKRISLAFGSFFSTLSNPGYAARVQELHLKVFHILIARVERHLAPRGAPG